MTHIARRSVIVGAGLLALAPRVFAAPAGKPRVLITTGHGTILVELEAKRAPISAGNFLNYVDAHNYDGGVFFRANRDPGSPGRGTIVGSTNPRSRPFPPVAHEPTTKTGLRHLAGTISLGRFAPGTATGDFFICASDEPYLDAHPGEKGDNLGYAAFGHTLQGLDVVRKILSLHTDPSSVFKEQRGQWLKPPVPIVSMKRV